MSDTASSRPSTVPAAWLLCADCASTLWETWHGRSLAIEVEHSAPCPAWPHDRREVALLIPGQADPPDEAG